MRSQYGLAIEPSWPQPIAASAPRPPYHTLESFGSVQLPLDYFLVDQVYPMSFMTALLFLFLHHN